MTKMVSVINAIDEEKTNLNISSASYSPSYPESSTTPGPYLPPFTNVDVTISACVLLPLSAFGIFSNLITIVVIGRSKKLRNIFNLLIVSLCVSDLCSALISPLFLYRRTWGFENWEVTSFLCKVYWGMDIWTSYVTSCHILLFALLRYISVKSPSQYYDIKKSFIKKLIAFVWIATCLVGFVPFTIMFGSRMRDRHAQTQDSKWPACSLNVEWIDDFYLYSMAAYSLLFYIPIMFVVALSIAIVCILLQQRKARTVIISSTRNSTQSISLEAKRQRDERQVILQLILIVGSFLLAYIPHTAYHFFSTSTISRNFFERRFDWWFSVLAHVCLRISECLNPIFYNMASRTLRRETINLIKQWLRCGYDVQLSSDSTPKRKISLPVSNPFSRGPVELEL